MIVQYDITADSWTAITSAGESGSCWLDEQGDGEGGKVDVRLFHDSSTPDDDDLTKGKRVYKPKGNNDLMTFEADDTTDIYYARCANTGDTATISVDAV